MDSYNISAVNSRRTSANLPAQTNDDEMKGFLYKWTNYVKGFQKRWFLLTEGFMYIYKHPKGWSWNRQRDPELICRGKIPLQNAVIARESFCTFSITDQGSQTWHFKTDTIEECDAWTAALKVAQAKCARIAPVEEIAVNDRKTTVAIMSHDLESVKRHLSFHLENLKSRHELIAQQGAQLQMALSALEDVSDEQSAERTRIANECATHFRVAANALVVAVNDYAHSAENRTVTTKGTPLHSLLFEDSLPFVSLKVVK